jgi:phospholipase/carboxylesterase
MPPFAGGAACQLIVLLHGVGAAGDDLIALAPALASRLPGAAFVAPHGPEPCDMAPFGRQWFSLCDRRPDALLRGVQSVAPLLDAFSMLNSSAVGSRITSWRSSASPREP